MNVFCQYTKYNRCVDQGLVNVMYNWNLLQPYHVKFADIFLDERVLIPYKHILKRGFPYCQGNYWENTSATIIHLYYQANLDFQRSVLKHCPRSDKSMRQYLSKNDRIEEIERSLENWDQNVITRFV